MKLTWDADDDTRKKALRKKMTEDSIRDDDFKVSTWKHSPCCFCSTGLSHTASIGNCHVKVSTVTDLQHSHAVSQVSIATALACIHRQAAAPQEVMLLRCVLCPFGL